MKQAKVLFYGISYYPELIATGKYSGEMCSWLSENGFDVRVVTAPPYYPKWRVFNNYSSWKYKIEWIDKIKTFRCPLYVPKTVTTFKRLLHLISFSVTSIPVIISQMFWKPNIIIVVVPTLFCLPAALLAAKLCRCKILLHIQDFELDLMLGLKMFPGAGLVKSIAYKVEKHLLRSCDLVTTISNSMIVRLSEKGVAHNKTALVPNWSDIEAVEIPMQDNYYRSEWNIDLNTIVILYSGNLGLKQGLEMLVQAAEYFIDRKDVIFIVVGDGVFKQNLIKMSETRMLPNLHFYDLQPKERLPDLLMMPDIHLVLQKKGTADNAFPSKLTNILAMGGTALITSQKCTELGRFVQDNPGIASLCEPEHFDEFIHTLKEMVNLVDVENRTMNVIARDYAKNNLNKEKILTGLKQKMLALIS